MEFGVLGTLEARHDGERVALGSFRQRSLLALLLIHANTVVSTDRILDELWGDEVGGDRQNALWVHVSNLRSALEPDRAVAKRGLGRAHPAARLCRRRSTPPLSTPGGSRSSCGRGDCSSRPTRRPRRS